MLLSLVLILLLIGAAVVGSLYSNFIVFYKSFSETDSYNKAYYASIAALERGELVTKQREPGYVGSGGWKGTTGINLTNNNTTDEISGGFSYLIKSDDTNLLRDVNSKTNRVPRENEGDVDWMLATGDSVNYNKMDYENAEVFLLYIDKSEGSPYSGKSCLNENDCKDVEVMITGQIRLPPKIEKDSKFGPLNINKSLIKKLVKDDHNDEIVDWQLRGKYDGEQFTIFARNKRDGKQDSVIKEFDINNTVILNFGGEEKKRQPNRNASINRDSPLVVIGSRAGDITRDYDTINSNKSFENILKDNTSKFSRLNLRLSLLNLLQAESSGMIYPYLEYYLKFDGNDEVADKYFKINGEGKYKDYQVNIIMHKPTVKESVLGNFTAIF